MILGPGRSLSSGWPQDPVSGNYKQARLQRRRETRSVGTKTLTPMHPSTWRITEDYPHVGAQSLLLTEPHLSSH
jgi:hypothetical protein